MLKIVASRKVYFVLRLVLGGLFVYAGILKLMDTTAFAVSIDGYGLVTWRMAKLLSTVLPAVEILTGVALVFDVKGSLGAIVAQLLVFIAVLSYAVYMGLDVDCGCFGSGESTSGHSAGLWPTIIRDLLMLAACLLMYWQRRVSGLRPRWLTR